MQQIDEWSYATKEGVPFQGRLVKMKGYFVCENNCMLKEKKTVKSNLSCTNCRTSEENGRISVVHFINYNLN